VLFTPSYALSYHVPQHARGNPTPVMADKESEQNKDSEHESPPTISRVKLENVTLDWDGVDPKSSYSSKGAEVLRMEFLLRPKTK